VIIQNGGGPSPGRHDNADVRAKNGMRARYFCCRYVLLFGRNAKLRVVPDMAKSGASQQGLIFCHS
jgi:hypothetical protein